MFSQTHASRTNMAGLDQVEPGHGDFLSLSQDRVGWARSLMTGSLSISGVRFWRCDVTPAVADRKS